MGHIALRDNCSSLFLSLFPGGSGKHRSKEPKKKNKQRLRFRAQNQHSDHLASARTSQWELNLRTSHWTKNQRKAASCCCTHILTDDYPEPHHLPTCLLAQPHLLPCPPEHNNRDPEVRHYKNTRLPCDIGINTPNTCFMPLPPAASPPAAVTSQVTLFSPPRPLPCGHLQLTLLNSFLVINNVIDRWWKTEGQPGAVEVGALNGGGWIEEVMRVYAS